MSAKGLLAGGIGFSAGTRFIPTRGLVAAAVIPGLSLKRIIAAGLAFQVGTRYIATRGYLRAAPVGGGAGGGYTPYSPAAAWVEVRPGIWQERLPAVATDDDDVLLMLIL